MRALLCEGGPTLNRALLAAGVVDELFLTLSPLLTGNTDAPRIVEGEDLPAPVRLRLEWVLHHDDELYLRYRSAMTDEALDRAHELAAAWLAALGERPVGAAGEAPTRCASRCPTTARTRPPSSRRSRPPPSRARGQRRPALLRLRHRRRLPAALAADWLTSAWDQNAALHVMSPAAAAAEETVVGWCRELLGLPAGAASASSPARRWPT